MRNGYKSQHGTWLLVLVSSRLLLPERGLLQEWLEELQALLAPPTLLSRLHFSPDCVCMTAVLRCCAHPSTTKPRRSKHFQAALNASPPCLTPPGPEWLHGGRPACAAALQSLTHVQTLQPGEGKYLFLHSTSFSGVPSCDFPPRRSSAAQSPPGL